MRDRGSYSSGLATALLALFLISFQALVVSGTTPAQAQTFSFSTIEIVGNERIEPAVIAGFAGIGRGETLTAGQLNAAYQRVVNSGLFEEVAFEPRGAVLVIRVREYPTISRINFEGNRRIRNEELFTIIESQARRVYSPTRAERDAASIAELYAERGRFAAEVTPRIIERSGNRVDLVFEIREGNVVEIERLSFVGNRTYSDRRLRQVLQTKQAGLLRTFVQRDTFLAERIELDKQLLRDFYLARGFIDFQVLDVTSEITREQDAFFLTFTVREGQSYRVGRVTGVSEIEGVSDEEVAAALRLRSGVVFSPTVIETNIARLERLASERGLRFARADPRITRNDRDRTVDVEFALVTGERIFVERIDIQGNATTLDRVIRRQFRISEGDPLNPREIREAAERIRALGYFADVEVEGRQGSAEDQVVVDVNVEETTTGSLGFGVNYSRADGIGATVNFTEANFLGRGQQVEFVFNTAKGNREFTFNFVEPAFLERDLQAGIGLIYRETERLRDSDFNTRAFQFSPSVAFPTSEFGRLGLRYTLQWDQLRNIGDDASAIIARDEGRFVTSSVGYTYTYDTRGSDLHPTYGFAFRFGQDFAGVGGDRRYVRTTALGVAEVKVLNEEVTLRAELEAGALNMISGNSRITERFQLADMMRGFAPGGVGPRDLAAASRDSLGGNFYTVARFEADFPLGLPEEYGIAGGLFMDVGTLWGLNDRAGGPQGGPVTLVDDSRHWRAAAGVSVFWETPIGPLRFNFSRPVRKMPYDRKQNFDISISSRF